MATALSSEFQTHSVFFGVGFIIPYIPSLSQRGIHTEIHLGTAETNHRFYSYRMKRQGRSWSGEGMEYILNRSHGDSNYRQSNELPRKT